MGHDASNSIMPHAIVPLQEKENLPSPYDNDFPVFIICTQAQLLTSTQYLLLSISLQFASSLRIAFGNPENEDSERNTHDTSNNQRPGVAPDLG